MLPHSFFVLVLSWQQINSIPLIPTNFYRIYSISSFFFYPHHCHTINALGNPKLSAYFTFIFIVSLFCSLFITLVNRFHSFYSSISPLSHSTRENQNPNPQELLRGLHLLICLTLLLISLLFFSWIFIVLLGLYAQSSCNCSAEVLYRGIFTSCFMSLLREALDAKKIQRCWH